MFRLMVVDGDFESQLRHNLQQEEILDNKFALQALQNNKFAVYKTHLDYLRAGAQIIRTNTYRVSVASLQTHLHLPESECLPVIYTAVQLAKQAVCKYQEDMEHDSSKIKYLTRQPLVAGSCGSYNASFFDDKTKILKDINNLAPKFLFSFHKQRTDALLDAGVDLLAFESIPSMNEAAVIIKILQSNLSIRAWITFLCQPEGNLLDGTTFTSAVFKCFNAVRNQFVAIGADCSSSDAIKPMMQNIYDNAFSRIPFIFYSDKCHFPTTEVNDESIATLQDNFVEEWLDRGVRYIGGGIDTVAEDIKEICKQVNDYCKAKGKTFAVLRPCSSRNTMNQSKL